MTAAELFATYGKAQALLAADDLRAAAALCKQLLDSDPDYAYGHHLMSRLFYRTGNMEKALEWAQRAIARAPEMALFRVSAGQILFFKKDFAAAEEKFRHALALEANNIDALGQLFASLMEQGKQAEARPVMDKLLTLQKLAPGAEHVLMEMRGETLETKPREFVTTLFDGYADHFDQHLQQTLGYKVPALMAEHARALPGMALKTGLSLLDLGCGTGLVAEAFKDMTTLRVGVDLSQKMLDRARAKQLYAELYCADIIEFMRADGRAFDIITVADVLIYTGDPAPLFIRAKKALAAGGLLLFSIETSERGELFHLNEGGRYSQNPRLLLTLAERHGYKPLIREAVTVRSEREQPVAGMLIGLQ